MAISLVSNVAMNGPSGGGTSTSIDTTGANLIIISLASYFGAGAPSVSDNKGNVFLARQHHLILLHFQLAEVTLH